MSTRVQNYLEMRIDWSRSPDPGYPYEAEYEGEKLAVRLNDFPDENLYTLIVNDEEVDDFDDWPELWAKP